MEPMATGDDLGQRHASMRMEVSNTIVQAMREYYGKGPNRAKTYMFDNYVLVVMEGGFTRVEETLSRSGHRDLVREMRQRFQNEMTDELCSRVERVVGRRTIGYQSQIIFEPETLIEFFILEPDEAEQAGPVDGHSR